ncbi:MAG: hypothetical protein WBC69_22360 [Geitlerinemataceae cyanobacterium]
MYPAFKTRQGKQSIQYPQNVKVLSYPASSPALSAGGDARNLEIPRRVK